LYMGTGDYHYLLKQKDYVTRLLGHL